MNTFNADKHTWGGSGIERVVYEYIKARVPAGSVAVELGAGHVSTPALASIYKLYSVEHNPLYCGLYPASTYIHAPVAGLWYNLAILAAQLPPVAQQALILVDGLNRAEILNHLDLFNPAALYVVHDTYREAELQLAYDLGRALNKPVTYHTDGDYWASIDG